MAHSDEEGESCLRYDGCSLALLPAPANTCDYVICYGEENDLECGTHRLQRSKGMEKTKPQKKSKASKVQEASDESWEDTEFEEDDSVTEEEEEEIFEEIS